MLRYAINISLNNMVTWWQGTSDPPYILHSPSSCNCIDRPLYTFSLNPNIFNASGFQNAEDIGLCSNTKKPSNTANFVAWWNCHNLPDDIGTCAQDKTATVSNRNIINRACDSSPPNCFQIGDSVDINCCIGHFNRVAKTHAIASVRHSPDVIILIIENMTNTERKEHGLVRCGIQDRSQDAADATY